MKRERVELCIMIGMILFVSVFFIAVYFIGSRTAWFTTGIEFEEFWNKGE